MTEKGDIVVDLAATDAAQTVNNFRFLSQQGFYDGVTFHRVESSPGFSLIQGGDPTASGRGGPGYTVLAEIGLPHRSVPRPAASSTSAWSRYTNWTAAIPSLATSSRAWMWPR